jgi:hypothetical protein
MPRGKAQRATAEAAANRRDEELRYSILEHARLNAQRDAHRWVSVSKLLIAARDRSARPVEDEAHGARLVDELKVWGLLEEREAAMPAGAAPDIRHRFVRYTDLAFDLLYGRVPPVPGVWDRRAA